MRISCSWSQTRGRRFAPSRGAAGHIRDVAGTRAVRARDRDETPADSKKHSYGPMHLWCRSACAERANRAPKASTDRVRNKRKYSRTCSRRRPARSKGDREMIPDPTRPKGLPRGAPSISMTRQASEKEHVMSFEEMAGNAESPNLPTEFKFDESPVR